MQGTRENAEGLVSKCLLQDVGGGGYRVHDLLLQFVKLKIKNDNGMAKTAAALQARFLGRLDVLNGFEDPRHGAHDQGLFALDALWRSVEELSSNPGLEVTSYNSSLGELDPLEVTAEVADCFMAVGSFYSLQVRKVFD